MISSKYYNKSVIEALKMLMQLKCVQHLTWDTKDYIKLSRYGDKVLRQDGSEYPLDLIHLTSNEWRQHMEIKTTPKINSSETEEEAQERVVIRKAQNFWFGKVNDIRPCDCGAKHTDTPKMHYDWCVGYVSSANHDFTD